MPELLDSRLCGNDECGGVAKIYNKSASSPRHISATSYIFYFPTATLAAG
jgi:hypothetical protein